MTIQILGINLPGMPRNTRLNQATVYLQAAINLDTILTPIPAWGKYVIQAMLLLIKYKQAQDETTCGDPPNDLDSLL